MKSTAPINLHSSQNERCTNWKKTTNIPKNMNIVKHGQQHTSYSHSFRLNQLAYMT